MGFLQDLDMWILNFINDHLHSVILDKVMIAISSLGNMGLVWILISVLLMMSKKYKRAGIMTICALILSSILGDMLLKHLIQRPRPFIADPATEILIKRPLSYSFPSGHTATAFAAAGTLAKTLKKYRGYVIALAVLIAFSRMYLFVHYPTDIVGGVILGLICSRIVLYSNELASKRRVRNRIW